MFEMTAAQQQAFQDGSGGVKAIVFNHSILWLVGIFATLWLIFVFLGYWKQVEKQHHDLGDFLFVFTWALIIYIAVGSMIFY